MQDERESSRDETEGSGQQQPVGQDSGKSEFGGIGGEKQPSASGSEPSAGTGEQGAEFAQSDRGGQSAATLSGRSDQQDLGQGRPGGTGGAEGEGFIGQQGGGSDDYLREGGGSSDATGGADFAREGQGAKEGDEADIESAQPRSQDKDSDIEGS